MKSILKELNVEFEVIQHPNLKENAYLLKLNSNIMLIGSYNDYNVLEHLADKMKCGYASLNEDLDTVSQEYLKELISHWQT